MRRISIVLSFGVAVLVGVLFALPVQSGAQVKLGDANCDGNLTSKDALLVLQLHAGLIDEVCGDVDVTGDGEVDSIDALFLLYFGLDRIFPLTPAPTEAPPDTTPQPTTEPGGDLTTYLQMSDLPNNEGIAISLTLANKNPWPVKRLYGTGQRYDVVVRDANGDYVWNFWHDTPWTQAGESQLWEPGEWVTYDATWRFEDKAGNDVGPGTYEMHAFDVGCTTDPTRQCDLGETIAVDIPPPPDCTGQDGLGADLIVSGGRETFSSGENVSLTLVLFNCGEPPATRGYSSGQQYDFVIQDEAGQVIWHWSHGFGFSQALTDRTFEQGEMFVHRTIWRQDTDERPLFPPELFGGDELVAPGAYTLSGFDVSGCRYTELDSCDLIASQTIEIVP